MSNYDQLCSRVLVSEIVKAYDLYHRNLNLPYQWDGAIEPPPQFKVVGAPIMSASFRLTDGVIPMSGASLSMWGYGLKSSYANKIILRGSTDASDWIANISTPFIGWGTGTLLAPHRVHVGFCTWYKMLIAQIDTIVREHFDQSNPCYITGHSLGGALATLISAYLAVKYPHMNIHLYTYASPIVGNAGFRDYFNKLVPNSFRIQNNGDIVPFHPKFGSDIIPRFFYHVGQAICFETRKGDYEKNHDIGTYKEAVHNDKERRDPGYDEKKNAIAWSD